jgi:hypothetical protein
MHYTLDLLVKEFEYYKFVPFKVKSTTGRWSHGYLYYLSKPINQARKEELLKSYNNTAFFTVKSQYAPEQVTSCLFIGKSVLRPGQ